MEWIFKRAAEHVAGVIITAAAAYYLRDAMKYCLKKYYKVKED